MTPNSLSGLRAATLTVAVTLVGLFAAPDAWAQRGPDRGDPQQRIEQHVDAIQQHVGLTDSQAQQVRAVLLDQDERAKAQRENRSEDRAARRAHAEALRAETDQRIEALLAPEQVEAYRAFVADQEARRGDRGGRGARRSDG